VYKRFARWSNKGGVWQRVFTELANDADFEGVFLDSTIERATDLIADIRTDAVIADEGYDADALVQRIRVSGTQAVIPPRASRKELRVYDTHLYKDRNLIERFFARIKHFRRIATRYEKLARSHMAFLHLVCTFVWLT
jgi:transposase